MKNSIYNREGKEVGTLELPATVFGLPWNADLVHQVVVSMQANERQNTAHTKGRGEVAGGGKKPWKQKGTGRARHGSIRSPIWKGGGVTHGPSNERIYDKKINKKMKTKALYTILSQKLRDGEVLFVDDLGLSTIKTKVAQQSINNLAAIKGFEKMNYKKGKRALFSVPNHDPKAVKSLRNIPGVAIEEVRNLNPLSALSYKYLVITNPKESLAAIAGRITTEAAK